MSVALGKIGIKSIKMDNKLPVETFLKDSQEPLSQFQKETKTLTETFLIVVPTHFLLHTLD